LRNQSGDYWLKLHRTTGEEITGLTVNYKVYDKPPNDTIRLYYSSPVISLPVFGALLSDWKLMRR